MKTLNLKKFCLYSAVFLIWAVSAPVLNAGSPSGSGSGSGSNDNGAPANLQGGNIYKLDICAEGKNGPVCCKVCFPKNPGNCGNGIVEAGEECEPGVGPLAMGQKPGWKCGAGCKEEQINPACGDGIQSEQEACDDGDKDDTNACTNACHAAKCGDNIKAGTEPCDDGNVISGDGCSATCETEYTCGNNTIDSGETCDDGNTENNDGCSSTCQSEGVCGNDIEEAGETCDDGGTLDGDGCDSVCQKENLCGNGQDDEGEECDDGNTTDGDGCDSSCEHEEIIIQGTASQDDASSGSGTATYSGTIEVTSGHTIRSWTAVSTTLSVCANPTLPSGSSSGFTGNYLEGQNLNECKLSFTATDNFGETSELYKLEISSDTTPCVSYTDDDGDIRSSLTECLDGETFTCTSAWNNLDGDCSCSEGTDDPC